MDDKEKAAIEAEARRDVAERGRHGPKVGRYLHVVEHHAIKENEEDLPPVAADEPRQPAGERQG
ncbi:MULTISPECIES: hypothetical protein [unclassified Amycolatopsis]|uniref:hypothetical protein n=1 Tax=unclassified Amycolatopsis TaxID=2618356 RepID=UPI0028750256|nr:MULTISPECIES: hypothetical protein [unclassified Amycolatopsis]MDS0134707.1 hypothetical protein [Amycolatopsis sp. 505]MDS0147394.1 hypothetical protein [Amycolatopsis sp. CM201R]